MTRCSRQAKGSMSPPNGEIYMYLLIKKVLRQGFENSQYDLTSYFEALVGGPAGI